MKTYKNTRKRAEPTTESNKNEVQDRLAAYSSPEGSPESLAASWLGLSVPLSNDLLLVEATRKGIKKEALLGLSKRMGLDLETLCYLLHISSRTFQRLPADATLDIFSSEQAIEMALVMARATQIFQDEPTIRQWLQTPLVSLNGLTPLSMMDTGFGMKMVMQTLGRLEQGIYA